MKFIATPIAGVWQIELERQEDERGFFARSYCQQEFAKHGIHDAFTQMNISYNQAQATLRGMHYQSQEAPESKVVRCIAGAVYDVALDLRPASPTFKRWFCIKLDSNHKSSLYIAPGIAHGFVTLTPGAELLYLMGGTYVPQAACGVRWNDPAFGIHWPISPAVMSERDRTYPDFIPS